MIARALAVAAGIAACSAPAAPRAIDNHTAPPVSRKRHAPHAKPLHVLLVGESLFVEGALLVIPDLVVTKSTVTEYELDRTHAATMDVVVFVGSAPVMPATADVILFGPSGANGPIAVGREVHKPTITAIAEHPITKDLELEHLSIENSVVFAPRESEGEIALVSAGNDALVLAKDFDGRRIVAFGFAIGESDLPLRTAFPMLMVRSMDWFAGP
jgi:hypothetical protein